MIQKQTQKRLRHNNDRKSQKRQKNWKSTRGVAPTKTVMILCSHCELVVSTVQDSGCQAAKTLKKKWFPRDPGSSNVRWWLEGTITKTKRKVFRFHDHSQKVIGSLRVANMWWYDFKAGSYQIYTVYYDLTSSHFGADGSLLRGGHRILTLEACCAAKLTSFF